METEIPEINQAFMDGWMARTRRLAEKTGETVKEFTSLEEFKGHIEELEAKLHADVAKMLGR